MAQKNVEGLDKLTRKLIRFPGAVTLGLRQEIANAGFLIQGQAIKSISKGSRSGVKYKRGGKSAQRSAPGEFPKTDRGGLVQSISVRSVLAARGFVVLVGTNLKYGRALEFGTLKMAARPWLGRTLVLNSKFIIGRISAELKKVLRKRSG